MPTKIGRVGQRSSLRKHALTCLGRRRTRLRRLPTEIASQLIELVVAIISASPFSVSSVANLPSLFPAAGVANSDGFHSLRRFVYSVRMNTKYPAPICAAVAPADRATNPRESALPVPAHGSAPTTATTKRTNLPTEKCKIPRLLHHQSMTSACNYRCFCESWQRKTPEFCAACANFSRNGKI